MHATQDLLKSMASICFYSSDDGRMEAGGHKEWQWQGQTVGNYLSANTVRTEDKVYADSGTDLKSGSCSLDLFAASFAKCNCRSYRKFQAELSH